MTSAVLGAAFVVLWVMVAQAAATSPGIGIVLGELGPASTLLLWRIPQPGDRRVQSVARPAPRRRADAPGPVLAGNTTLTDAIDMFVRSDGRAIPVMDANRLAGLVSMTDIRRIPHQDQGGTPVGAVMTPFPQLVTVSARDTVTDALRASRREPFTSSRS